MSFRFGTSVSALKTDGDKVSAVQTDKGEIAADGVVLCLGVYTPQLARQIGLNLPVYPVKGYSITAPVSGRNNPPTIGGVDEENLVAYAPYGDRVRATATAEFSGYDTLAQAVRLRAYAQNHARAFPVRRRLVGLRILGGTSPDDAGRNADPRANALAQSVAQYRAWVTWAGR